MVSNAVLKNNFSITTKRVRLTRSQLEKQSSGLKALYALSSGIGPASSSSSCSRTNSESSFTHSEEGSVSAASPRGSLGVITKENINKNQFSCDDLSLGSIMSPIPSQGDDDGEEGNADDDEVAQLVTLSPKSPTTPTFTPEQRSAYPLNGITEPGPNDYLYGRGGGTNHHPGNKSYRVLVESRKDLYSKSEKSEKPLVATGIISDWHGFKFNSCSRTNSESSSTHSEEGSVSAASRQRLTRGSLRVITKENIGEEGNADDEEVSQLVTLSPKPPTTPTFTPEQRSAYPLNGITEPGPNDYLYGRGGGTNHHPGNKSYRVLVESRKDLYSKSEKSEKSSVAMRIISDWRELAHEQQL